MTYYYIVDNALLKNNLTIFEDENEFQDSLNFNLDEAIENELITPEEANIIVDDFNEYTEVEQEINGFTYGKTSDKEDLLNTYSLKVEDCDTTDVKLEDDDYYIEQIINQDYDCEFDCEDVNKIKNSTSEKGKRLLYVMGLAEAILNEKIEEALEENGFENGIDFEYDVHSGWTGFDFLKDKASADKVFDDSRQKIIEELNKALAEGRKYNIDETDLEVLNIRERHFFGDTKTGKSCTHASNRSKCKDSQAQEIGEEYRRLSEKYGVDMDELVYGRDGFMNSCYPHNTDYVYFPDFNGDVIFSEKHWNELVDWAKKNKGINLEAKKEGNFWDSDSKKLSDKIVLILDTDLSTASATTPQGCAYKWDGNEPLEKFARRCYNGDWKNGELVRDFMNESHDEFKLDEANKVLKLIDYKDGKDKITRFKYDYYFDGDNLDGDYVGDSDSTECDNDACFEVTSYIGTNYRGIDDTANFTDISKLQEWLWEKLSKGNFVEVEKAPKEFEEWVGKYNPDKINPEEDIADYEYLLTLKETNNKGNFRDNSQNLFKDTDDCDTIEISDEEVNVPFNQNISFDELRNIFYDHNSENGIKGQFEDKAPLYGNVVISQDSFNKPYSEEERTYVFRSDNKAFLSNMIGNSIISNSKDGSDTGVRLDWYLWDGWKIERCYITKEE